MELKSEPKISFDLSEAIELNELKASHANDSKVSGVEELANGDEKCEHVEGCDDEGGQGWAVADSVISCCIIAPLVVGSWKGLWVFMNVYPQYFPALPVAGFGIFLHIVFAILRFTLHRRRAGGLWSRVYCWCFMTACVCQWRGTWEAWSHAVDAHKFAAPWSASCLFGLLILKAIRNLITAPYIVQIDSASHTYRFRTRFEQVFL